VFIKRRKPEDPPASEPNLNAPPGESLPGGIAGTGYRSSDSGLGVPPFRPAPPKEATPMSRSPFSAAPAPPGAPPVTGQPRPGMPGRPPSHEPAERRTLVVGRGISVQGTVQDAERLVVEGTVEASMIHATELSISPGGVFKGEVEVEDAEVAGTIDGTLTARGNLIVRATGKLLGTARCRRLQVEDGGQISGRMEMLGDQPAGASSPAASVEPD
jgi:cytoskeletal protein CcmA (bactofilin family)